MYSRSARLSIVTKPAVRPAIRTSPLAFHAAYPLFDMTVGKLKSVSTCDPTNTAPSARLARPREYDACNEPEWRGRRYSSLPGAKIGLLLMLRTTLESSSV